MTGLRQGLRLETRDFHAGCVKITPSLKLNDIIYALFAQIHPMALTLLSCLLDWVANCVKRDEKRMKTLLRRVSTGLYFQGPDQWTCNPAQAHNFKMIDRAVEFVDRWQLNDIELAFAFDDPEEVTAVPLEKIELRYSEG